MNLKWKYVIKIIDEDRGHMLSNENTFRVLSDDLEKELIKSLPGGDDEKISNEEDTKEQYSCDDKAKIRINKLIRKSKRNKNTKSHKRYKTVLRKDAKTVVSCLNARGVRNYERTIEWLMDEERIDALCCQETHLDSTVSANFSRNYIWEPKNCDKNKFHNIGPSTVP